MPATRASFAREVVSESSVAPSFFRDFEGNFPFDPAGDARIVAAASLCEVIRAWRSEIDREASRLRRHAESNLSELPPGCIYQNLDQVVWRNAALICEVFRHPSISKNAGRLDTGTLQSVIYKQLTSTNEIRFVIAWGQSKRDAGRLKTLGPSADLAELYSIARLGAIILAVAEIASVPAKLIVRTGGSRFVSALFTRRAHSEAYDSQRQRLADALVGAGILTFRPYTAEVDKADNKPADLNGREFDDHIIAAKFQTILLNIDWDNIFSPNPDGAAIAPHGAQLPAPVRSWLTNSDDESRLKLIRNSIIALINPKALSHCVRAFPNDEEVLEETLSFMQRTAWLSTREYLHLHESHGQEECDHGTIESGYNAVRLTVHEKRDRRDIPAILTLGLQGGNLLSQHVLAVIDEQRNITFETYAEIHKRDITPVLVEDVGRGDRYPFDWLAGKMQPLCFVSRAAADPLEQIGRVLSSWGANA